MSVRSAVQALAKPVAHNLSIEDRHDTRIGPAIGFDTQIGRAKLLLSRKVARIFRLRRLGGSLALPKALFLPGFCIGDSPKAIAACFHFWHATLDREPGVCDGRRVRQASTTTCLIPFFQAA